MIIVTFDNRSGIEVDDLMLEEIETKLYRTLLHEKIGVECEVSYSFVNGEEIKELNGQYRQKNQVTDVLSFPMYDDFLENKEDILEKTPHHPILLGDIVVNTDQARLQGEELGHGFLRELSYLSVHSLLHLLGYDHLDGDDKKMMRKVEKELMGDD